MRRRSFEVWFLGVVVALLCGCRTAAVYPLARPSDWSRAEYWYQDANPVDADKVDVFYVDATEIMSSKDSNGKASPLAVLSQEECNLLSAEAAWFRKHIYTTEFNFFSPMYHQVTFEALMDSNGGKSTHWNDAAKEVCEAFDYYMAHKNGGRRFILSGFSQGADILRALLMHMTDEQFSRCVAAYSIGFQVTAEDLKSPRINAAKGPDDQGVIISFNSVADLEGRWDFLSGEAACSINPVNWRTDDTPAEFEVNGLKLTATLDVANNLVVVKGFTPGETPFSKYFPKGNLHIYEMIMYAKPLRENAILRAYGSKPQ